MSDADSNVCPVKGEKFALRSELDEFSDSSGCLFGDSLDIRLVPETPVLLAEVRILLA